MATNTTITLQAMQVEAHAGTLPLEHSFASVQPENVVLTAMKKAEDSDSLIFHAYEWAGKSSNVTFTVPEGRHGRHPDQPSRTAAGIAADDYRQSTDRAHPPVRDSHNPRRLSAGGAVDSLTINSGLTLW